MDAGGKRQVHVWWRGGYVLVYNDMAFLVCVNVVVVFSGMGEKEHLVSIKYTRGILNADFSGGGVHRDGLSAPRTRHFFQVGIYGTMMHLPVSCCRLFFSVPCFVCV